MRRLFYLFRKKCGTYYAEFLNSQTGSGVCYRSLRTDNRDQALITASEWAKNGIPAQRRGMEPIYQKLIIEAIAGMNGIIKALQNTELSPDDAIRIVEVLKARELIDIAAVKNMGKGAVPFIQFLTSIWRCIQEDTKPLLAS